MDPRIALLAFGSFAVGTGSLIVTGLLDLLARDLGSSVSAAGQLTTAFAVTVALAGPLLATLTGRMDRQTVLILGLALFAAGQAASALAPGFGTLLAARVLAGLGASLYTPHASTAGALLVPPERRGRAIATVFGGFVLATVLGVPFTTALGAAAGWRVAFGAAALLPVLALALLAWKLPRGLHAPPADGAAWRALFRSPGMLMLVGVTALQIGGQLTVFVYLTPLFKTTLALTDAQVGWLFMLYGLANVAGNAFVARRIDRIGAARLTTGALVGTLLSLLLLPLAQDSLAAAVPLLVFWGFTSFAINAGTQARLVGAAPWLATAALPLNSSAIYVGQAAGAMLGGFVIAHGWLAKLGWIGAAGVAVALWLSEMARRRPAPARPAGA